jgi:hypothetical protein
MQMQKFEGLDCTNMYMPFDENNSFTSSNETSTPEEEPNEEVILKNLSITQKKKIYNILSKNLAKVHTTNERLKCIPPHKKNKCRISKQTQQNIKAPKVSEKA